MERNEVPKLFSLLRQLYARFDKQPDRVTSAIWAEILKPWSYEQVRDAVIRRARENQYCPDPSEIVEYLPPVEPMQEEEKRQAFEIPQSCIRETMAWREMLLEVLESCGMRPFDGNTGAEYAAWRAKCAAAGVDFEGLAEAAHAVAYGSREARCDA